MKRLILTGALLCALIIPAAAAQAAPATQQAELSLSDAAAGDALGLQMAISGDTMVVLGPSRGANPQAVAYVFVRPASGWADAKETAQLSPPGTTRSDDMNTVAISGDTIVAGAQNHKVGDTTGQGAMYVFTKPAGGWQDSHDAALLTASDGSGNEALGNSVAVSGDTAVASAIGHKVGDHAQQGAAYVFVKPAAGWKDGTQTAELTASDGAVHDSLSSV